MIQWDSNILTPHPLTIIRQQTGLRICVCFSSLTLKCYQIFRSHIIILLQCLVVVFLISYCTDQELNRWAGYTLHISI